MTRDDNTKFEGEPASQEIAKSDVEAIQAGIEDMEAGRFRPLAEADAEIRAKYKIKPIEQDH